MSSVEMSSNIASALAKLKEHGLKSTQKRREIIELFAQEERYVKATYIHSILSANYSTMSYNTTYRNLYDFVELGILETTEFNGEQYFRMNCSEAGHHHHHFICTDCGATIPLYSCPMDLDSVHQALKNVKIHSHRFEIFGLCESCVSKK